MPRRRPTPPMPPPGDDPLLAQALTDLSWYERSRDRARRWHWATELSALITGAATVVAAGTRAPAIVTASVAGATVFIGGARQVYGHTERHVVSAEAWLRLRLAIQRYQLIPEAERDADSRQRLLEEMEATATAELQDWAAYRRAQRTASRPGAQ
ncbi:SLATT domain-containing protein [Streptomyces sp. NPDC059373]